MQSLSLLGLLLALPQTSQDPIDATLPNGGAPVVTATALGGTSRATSACDDFNRASGTNMGADWTEMLGDLGITANTGYGVGTSNQWMQHNSLTAPYSTSTQEVDFLRLVQGSNLRYVALVAGIASSTTNVFVKVQDNNSDGLYDRVFFYRGINGGNWGTNSTTYFFDLAVPTLEGRMQVTFTNAGDTAVLKVDRNFDGVYDETFMSNGLLTSGSTFGQGFGLGVFNSPGFDNYEVNGGCGCTAPTLGVAGATAGGTATATVNCATANGAVVLGYSLAGGGPVNVNAGCAVVTVSMSPPFTQVNLTANAGGTAAFTTNVPAGTTGVNVWTQAFDVASCALTNGVQVTL